ncbi:MAG: hypothetical protein CMN55_12340 [Sneathiella sp.]|jgi:uncharacterized protein (DUF983 family)|uniref:DUF983 domain-containing protein n=1 Tax=Sneathiella sp. TaxID=1964365 RepID=UPI000C5E428F|nr:DUF983 domain-containing protein [Sneathiella sp.]MAL79879.1 hypothetical protein [Sneathiella sp.]|tara:strand:- start:692 stop:1075 length:384 start_codon:yes stop_codon:yes gene_type:complete
MHIVTAPRSVAQAILHGLRRRCPNCGEGQVFNKYIKVNHTCDHCGLELHHQRADDAPPYFTMFIVLHVVISGLVALEQAYSPAMWVQLALWLPISLVFALWLLPRVKGALIGIQWARQMHGFGGDFT